MPTAIDENEVVDVVEYLDEAIDVRAGVCPELVEIRITAKRTDVAVVVQPKSALLRRRSQVTRSFN